jgi:3-oxoacyl-ACP reductase-like protein
MAERVVPRPPVDEGERGGVVRAVREERAVVAVPAAAPVLVPVPVPAPVVASSPVVAGAAPEELWRRVLAAAGSGAKAALASKARLERIEGSQAVLVASPTHAATVRTSAKMLGDLIGEVLGRPVVVTVREGEGPVGGTVAAGASAVAERVPMRVASGGGGAGGGGGGGGGGEGLREHPLVRTVQDLFPGARVVDVQGRVE